MPISKQKDAYSPLASEQDKNELAKAFADDAKAQTAWITDSPLMRFVVAHESAGTPDTQTVCGVHTVRVTLGDVKAIMNLFR